jgi:N-acetylornithine carbamoyltransferase
MMDLKGRHLITAQDWSLEEIEQLIDYAASLKAKMKRGIPHRYLDTKTLFMIFFEESTRTRNAFETGMTQLGGHANDSLATSTHIVQGESSLDTAKVLSRYGHGIAVRYCEWGVGNTFIAEVAEHASIPVINLQSDVYHPTQIIADLMTIRERFGANLSGLKIVCSWAYSPNYLKPMSVPQSLLLLMTRMGMEVTLARPAEFGLMPSVVAQARANAEASGGDLELVEDIDEAYRGAVVVYPLSWGCFLTSEDKDEAKATSMRYRSWICDTRRMELADESAVYMNCLPAARGYEVTDQVIDGPRSIVFDQAENRLHVAKSILASTM